MKELVIAEDIYLDEYDVNVHPYLSLAEIQSIVKGVCAVDTNDYVDRKMAEDMLVLFHATDISKEELENVDYDMLNRSGLINGVRKNIKNIGLIKECLEYTESFTRAIIQLAPQIMPIVEKMGALNGNSNKE